MKADGRTEAGGASSGAHPARSGRPRSSRCPRPAGRCRGPGRTGQSGPAACTPAVSRSLMSQHALTPLQAGALMQLVAIHVVLMHGDVSRCSHTRVCAGTLHAEVMQRARWPAHAGQAQQQRTFACRNDTQAMTLSTSYVTVTGDHPPPASTIK